VLEGCPGWRSCLTQQYQPPPVGARPAQRELCAAVILHLAVDLGWQAGLLVLQPPAEAQRMEIFEDSTTKLMFCCCAHVIG
jgi:hypothetical protein